MDKRPTQVWSSSVACVRGWGPRQEHRLPLGAHLHRDAPRTAL